MAVIRLGQQAQIPQQAGRDVAQRLHPVGDPKTVQHSVIGPHVEHGCAATDGRRAEETLVALPLGLGQAGGAAIAVVPVADIDGIRVDDVPQQVAATAKQAAIVLLATAITAQVGDPVFPLVVTGEVEQGAIGGVEIGPGEGNADPVLASEEAAGGMGRDLGCGIPGHVAQRAVAVERNGDELPGPVATVVAGLIDVGIAVQPGGVGGHRTGGAVAGRDLGQSAAQGRGKDVGVTRAEEAALAVERRVPQVIDLVLRNIGRVLVLLVIRIMGIGPAVRDAVGRIERPVDPEPNGKVDQMLPVGRICRAGRHLVGQIGTQVCFPVLVGHIGQGIAVAILVQIPHRGGIPVPVAIGHQDVVALPAGEVGQGAAGAGRPRAIVVGAGEILPHILQAGAQRRAGGRNVAAVEVAEKGAAIGA